MNKSQILKPNQEIRRKQLSVQILPSSSSQIQHIQWQLNDLKAKVNQSKPILECIYDKIKRKQQNYLSKLREKQQKCQKLDELIKQYRSFHHQSLKIMQRNNILQGYCGSNNYKSNKFIQQYACQVDCAQKEPAQKDNYQSLDNLCIVKNQGNQRTKEIIQTYKETKRKEAQNLQLMLNQRQSIYDKYKKRLSVKEQQTKEKGENTQKKNRSTQNQRDQNKVEMQAKNKENFNKVTKTKKRESNQRVQTREKKQYFLLLQKRKLKKK